MLNELSTCTSTAGQARAVEHQKNRIADRFLGPHSKIIWEIKDMHVLSAPLEHIFSFLLQTAVFSASQSLAG